MIVSVLVLGTYIPTYWYSARKYTRNNFNKIYVNFNTYADINITFDVLLM